MELIESTSLVMARAVQDRSKLIEIKFSELWRRFYKVAAEIAVLRSLRFFTLLFTRHFLLSYFID